MRKALWTASMLLVACTTTGRLETRMPIMTDLAPYPSLGVVVTFEPGVLGGSRWGLHQMLVQKLGAASGMPNVAAGSAPGGRGVTLHVKGLQMPRGGVMDRSIFANAEVRLDVELVDDATGNVIGASTVESRASMGALWSAAGRRAVRLAVDKVAEFVARH